MRRAALIAALVIALRTLSAAVQEDPRLANLADVVDRASRLRTAPLADRAPSDAPAGGGEKCGLWLSLAVTENWEKFAPDQRERLAAFLAPPATQKERLIGRFRIHYDTTGFEAAAMLGAGQVPIPNSAEEYVDSVGAFFNEVYEHEIDTLGYDSPLQPGQSSFDLYVSNIGYYGLTQTLGTIGGFSPPRYTTYIEIDNDYRGFFSSGMAGLKVTAAHEFHHAVQLGSYGYRPGEQYFLEITSTWMEDMIYDGVNDYYQYVKDPNSIDPDTFGTPRGQFASPELSFTFSNGLIEYSRAVWGKYVEERYSADVMRRTWEEIRLVPTLAALDRALSERSSSLRQAFLEWTAWNYRAGANADPALSYREGAHYPNIRIRAQYAYASPSRSYPDSVRAFGSAYHKVRVSDVDMIAIVSNVNGALPGGWQRFSYEMQDEDASPYKRLSNGISVRVNVPDPENWSSQEDVPTLVADVLVYPNPFIRGRSPHITFRLPVSTASSRAELLVLSAGLDGVFSGELPVVQLRPLEQSIRWDALDEAGRDVPSGVYFFVVSVDGKDFKGKLIVIGG